MPSTCFSRLGIAGWEFTSPHVRFLTPGYRKVALAYYCYLTQEPLYLKPDVLNTSGFCLYSTSKMPTVLRGGIARSRHGYAY